MVALTEKLNLMALGLAWGVAPGFNNTPLWGLPGALPQALIIRPFGAWLASVSTWRKAPTGRH